MGLYSCALGQELSCEGTVEQSAPRALPLAWWHLVLSTPPTAGSPGPSSFGDLVADLETDHFCLRHGSQSGTSVCHPLAMATSPCQGRSWRDLYPFEPGCWGTPKAMGCPEPQFSSSSTLLGSGVQPPGQGEGISRAPRWYQFPLHSAFPGARALSCGELALSLGALEFQGDPGLA